MKFMYIPRLLKSFISLLLLIETLTSAGQNSNLLNNNSVTYSQNIEITSLPRQQTDYIKRLYFNEIETPKELINGKEYESYYTRSANKPLLYS